jgi:hypothetical protein
MEQHQRKQEETTVADDPKARELLRHAFEKTARWQKDFKGFTADLTVNVNGKETSGPVMVKGPREVSVQLGEADVQKWAQEQLGMIAVHRGPRTFEESDGKYSLTMEEDGHPFGTKLIIHGSNSFYRVKDNRITQINRKMAHPGMTPVAFTINVEESAVTQDQKNLTTKYCVYYYSPTDGKLNNVESFTDTHVRIGSSDLPATRRIITYENGEVIVKNLTFTNHLIQGHQTAGLGRLNFREFPGGTSYRFCGQRTSTVSPPRHSPGYLFLRLLCRAEGSNAWSWRPRREQAG